MTSLPAAVAAPARLLESVRREWGIENSLHYRRDVTLGEDNSRLRRGHAPQVNAIINNILVGILLLAGYTNIAAARRHFAAHPAKALALLAQPIVSSS